MHHQSILFVRMNNNYKCLCGYLALVIFFRIYMARRNIDFIDKCKDSVSRGAQRNTDLFSICVWAIGNSSSFALIFDQRSQLCQKRIDWNAPWSSSPVLHVLSLLSIYKSTTICCCVLELVILLLLRQCCWLFVVFSAFFLLRLYILKILEVFDSPLSGRLLRTVAYISCRNRVTYFDSYRFKSGHVILLYWNPINLKCDEIVKCVDISLQILHSKWIMPLTYNLYVKL